VGAGVRGEAKGLKEEKRRGLQSGQASRKPWGGYFFLKPGGEGKLELSGKSKLQNSQKYRLLMVTRKKLRYSFRGSFLRAPFGKRGVVVIVK